MSKWLITNELDVDGFKLKAICVEKEDYITIQLAHTARTEVKRVAKILQKDPGEIVQMALSEFIEKYPEN